MRDTEVKLDSKRVPSLAGSHHVHLDLHGPIVPPTGLDRKFLAFDVSSMLTITNPCISPIYDKKMGVLLTFMGISMRRFRFFRDINQERYGKLGDFSRWFPLQNPAFSS